MTILPGLTSTIKERIPRFIDDLRESDIRHIALFPTVLTRDERVTLYRDLESIPGLVIPHIHLRTDYDETEMAYVVERFGTEVFNIHPSGSRHPFPGIPEAFASRIYVENVEEPVGETDLRGAGGICPDFAHLEAARHQGRTDYVTVTEDQLADQKIGCCHVAGIRVGDPNDWSGGWDHHNFKDMSDLSYMARYAEYLPAQWVSLELENPLHEQMEAVAYLTALLHRAPTA